MNFNFNNPTEQDEPSTSPQFVDLDPSDEYKEGNHVSLRWSKAGVLDSSILPPDGYEKPEAIRERRKFSIGEIAVDLFAKTHNTLRNSDNNKHPIKPADKEPSITEIRELAVEKQETFEQQQIKEIFDRLAEIDEDLGDRLSSLETETKELIEQRKFNQLRALREGQFNAVLVSTDELDKAIAMGMEGVSKRKIYYHNLQTDEYKINVYDLNGLPFKCLMHDVKYRFSDPESTGYKTAKKLLSNPAFWMRDQSERVQGQYWTPNQEAGTICCLFCSTDTQLATVPDDGLAYGFAGIRPKSLLKTHISDGHTPSDKEATESLRSIGNSPNDLLYNQQGPYNEVTLGRYDDNGQPYKPDFILTSNNNISDYAITHAFYYGIPIINIDNQAYINQQRQGILESVDGVVSSDNYDDIVNLFTQIKVSDKSALDINISSSFSDNSDNLLAHSHEFQELSPEYRSKIESLFKKEQDLRRKLLINKLRDASISPATNSDVVINRFTTVKDEHTCSGISIASPITSSKYPEAKLKALTTVYDDDPSFTELNTLVDNFVANGGHLLW